MRVTASAIDTRYGTKIALTPLDPVNREMRTKQMRNSAAELGAEEVGVRFRGIACEPFGEVQQVARRRLDDAVHNLHQATERLKLHVHCFLLLVRSRLCFLLLLRLTYTVEHCANRG